MSDFTQHQFHHNDKTGNLDTTGCGTAAGTKEQQTEQDRLGKFRPEVKIRRNKACCTHNCRHLEDRMSECGLQCRIVFIDIESDQQCCSDNDKYKGTQFFISPHVLEIPHDHQIEQVKVHRKQQHENRDDIFKISAVIGCDTCIFIGKTTCPCCGDTMDDTVKKRHSPCKKQDDLQKCQYNINDIQYFCRRFYSGYQFGNQGPGSFGSHQMHGSVITQRHDRQHEYQNPHTTDPVGKTSPEQDRIIQMFNFCQCCCTCCCKTGYCFKIAVDKSRNRFCQVIRKCPENRHNDPGGRRYDKAFPAVDSFIFRLTTLQDCPYDQTDHGRCNKGSCRQFFSEVERHYNRH